MPVLFNFHILLATFYTISGTNTLIQCLVPVPICCMFYVSQKPNIKRSPNGIKTDEDFFGIYVIFGKKNQRETMPEGDTRQGRALGPRGHLEASLTSTPIFLDCFHSKNNAPEGFIPFGLCLIFLFFETLK